MAGYRFRRNAAVGLEIDACAGGGGGPAPFAGWGILIAA